MRRKWPSISALTADVDTFLQRRSESLFPHLTERQRRLWAGAEARAMGRGGISAVVRATGMARTTVMRGLAELDGEDLPFGRSRRTGGGRRRRLTNAQLEELKQLLSQGATAHGWPNELWTSKRVAEVVRRHFHVPCCAGTACKILTRYMGWTPQRPIQQLRERDEEEIAS